MLFAVLAVATNYTDLSYHKRVATSQAFGKHVSVIQWTSSYWRWQFKRLFTA